MIPLCVLTSGAQKEFATTICQQAYAMRLAGAQAGAQAGVQVGVQARGQANGQPEREKTEEKTGENTGEKNLALVASNPSIIMRDLAANRLEITSKGVDWQVRVMKRMGMFERIVPDKGGYWQITGTNNE